MLKYIYIGLFILIGMPCFAQTEVYVRELCDNAKYSISRYLYANERPYATFNGERFVKDKQSQIDKKWDATFLSVVEELKALGLKIKYANLMYDEICIIHTMLSCLDTKTESLDGDSLIVEKNNINHLYTHLFQRTDYVHSFRIFIRNGYVENCEYVCCPDFSEELTIYHYKFSYDDKGRVKEITEISYDKGHKIKNRVEKSIGYIDKKE